MSAPVRVGDRVTLNGDAMDDLRAEELVEAGFGFHDVGRVIARVPRDLATVGAGELLVRVSDRVVLPVRALELRAYRP